MSNGPTQLAERMRQLVLNAAPSPQLEPEHTIRRFIAFCQVHENEPLAYETGRLMNRGCDGEFGTCCSTSFDLGDLADELEDLVGWNG